MLAIYTTACVAGKEHIVFTKNRGGLGLVHMDVNDLWFDIYELFNGIITTNNISTQGKKTPNFEHNADGCL